MILLIVGLHCILGSIWLLNNEQQLLGGACFLVGMAATHYGWKDMHRKKKEEQK